MPSWSPQHRSTPPWPRWPAGGTRRLLGRDGSTAVGFACDAVAAAGGKDITAWGDWLADLSVEPKPRTVWRDLGVAALAGFSRGERA
ncbi:hypothetical protein QF050_000475 [Arthrobacter sp. SLBN-112]|nr:hypothetical protein [Arthrobacter sp. SLBN-112]